MQNNKQLAFSSETPWLAPLAGWTDLPFRILCREQGAAVCFTEMVSAKGLMYKNSRTEALLRTIPEDNPLIIQLCGSEASIMKDAIYLLIERGHTWFDCNMGCSVPKITRNGAGASILKNIDHAISIAEAMIHAAGKQRVGFKLRLGWDESQEPWRIISKTLEELGAGWITLHPRTAKQGFTGTANWEKLTELSHLVTIPVIASGDLLTAEDGIRCLQKTNVHTVMYARGALRDPSIFNTHKKLIRGEQPTTTNEDLLLARILRHCFLACRYSSPQTALLKMRTIIPRYIRHLNKAKQLRIEIIHCRNWHEFERIINKFFETHITIVNEDYP